MLVSDLQNDMRLAVSDAWVLTLFCLPLRSLPRDDPPLCNVCPGLNALGTLLGVAGGANLGGSSQSRQSQRVRQMGSLERVDGSKALQPERSS